VDRHPCRACGRPIERLGPRGEVLVYCSKRCRERRISPLDRRLEELILEHLARGVAEPGLCPTVVARAARAEDWQALVEPVRRAGRRLALRGLVRFVQRGRDVDPGTARGEVHIVAVRPPRPV
jgi:hypothetical protein